MMAQCYCIDCGDAIDHTGRCDLCRRDYRRRKRKEKKESGAQK